MKNMAEPIGVKFKFSNFQEKKWKSLRLIATTFSMLRLILLDSMSTYLVNYFLLIILHLFYFIYFWKVNTKVFSLVVSFRNSQLNLLS